MLAKITAGAFLALAITISTPLAAQAENYVPKDSLTPCSGMSVSPAAVEPGGSVTVRAVAGTFPAGEAVALRLSTTAGAPAVAGDPTASAVAAADGSLSGSLALPSEAAGSWRINETTASVDQWCGVVSVVSDGSPSSAAEGDTLPVTGGGAPTGLVATAGGLLVAGAAAAGLATVRRRRRRRSA